MKDYRAKDEQDQDDRYRHDPLLPKIGNIRSSRRKKRCTTAPSPFPPHDRSAARPAMSHRVRDSVRAIRLNTAASQTSCRELLAYSVGPCSDRPGTWTRYPPTPSLSTH